MFFLFTYYNSINHLRLLPSLCPPCPCSSLALSASLVRAWRTEMLPQTMQEDTPVTKKKVSRRPFPSLGRGFDPYRLCYSLLAQHPRRCRPCRCRLQICTRAGRGGLSHSLDFHVHDPRRGLVEQECEPRSHTGGRRREHPADDECPTAPSAPVPLFTVRVVSPGWGRCVTDSWQVV